MVDDDGGVTTVVCGQSGQLQLLEQLASNKESAVNPR